MRGGEATWSVVMCHVPARASEGQVAMAWSPHRQSTQDVTTRGNALKTSPSTLIMSTILRLESLFQKSQTWKIFGSDIELVAMKVVNI